MTPEEIAERGILQVYADMLYELRRLDKIYDQKDLKATKCYNAIEYMEDHYTEVISKFKSNNNKLLYDVKISTGVGVYVQPNTDLGYANLNNIKDDRKTIK